MQMIKSKTAKRSFGFTLIELVVGIAIVAILLTVVGPRIKRAFTGASLSNITGEIQDIHTNMVSAYSGQLDFGSAGANINNTAINYKVFPGSMRISGSTVTNLLDGAVNIVSNGMTYTLSYGGFSDELCAKAATSPVMTIWRTLKINSNTPVTPPLTAATAQAQCNAGGNANSIEFTGGRS